MKQGVARSLALVPLALAIGIAQAQESGQASRYDALAAKVEAQAQLIRQLRADVAAQDGALDELRQALAEARLDASRGRGLASDSASAQQAPDGAAPTSGASTADASYAAQAEPQGPQPVGTPPASQERPPEIAQIFDQPGVLTPRGRFVLEPSLQFGYSATDRVALVGYTVIPAILIGLIDVRQVKTTTGVATLAGRFGVTDRMEIEARLPYVYINSDTVSREIFTGSAQDEVFNADGSGLGDAELTVRYQLNRGGADRPFYIGWLRYKSRTGKDPFEVVTDCVTRCVANATGTGLPLELPTGSGFEAIQPGITFLFPSDPIVFFGSLSYLHNFERSNVSRTVLTGAPEGFPQTTTEPLGDVKAGDIVGFNLGLGLALNEKASISMGLDTSFVGKTEMNGEDAPGAVRMVLGTLVLGGSYRFSDTMNLNVALGVGVTRDTPDMMLTARLPISF
ncbi:MAG TPA: acetate kinase [Xanthomonadaceae bacterium]|nr:acetate kinase [Xanthomonadaceae bacterium]